MAKERSLPPLTAIRAFEAVARLGSFTEAARELGATQAAVSYQIKLLEERAGAPLFLRRPRGIELTEAGRLLAPGISEAFERIAGAWEAARAGAGGVLRLTTTLTFATNWLARRLGAFQIAHPKLAVQLDTSQRLLDFRRDEIDVAVRVGDGNWPGLEAHRLFGTDFTPMLSPALVARAGPLREPADLLRLPLVHPEDPWWGEWFAAAGLLFRAAEAISAGGHLGAQVYDAGAAIGGQGAAILTRAFYGGELADGRLIQPFELLGGRGTAYWLAYPEERRALPRIRAFRDWLLGEVARDAGSPQP